MVPAVETSIRDGQAAKLADGIDTWIFDLDDTLYPRSSGLHEKMLARVVELIRSVADVGEAEARRLHARYYDTYGTSLIGLNRHHGVPPSRFIDFVHEVDIDAIARDPRLRPLLAALPGRRIVFTNGSRRHATRILEHLGIADLFEAICDIEACGFVGKPGDAAFETLFCGHTVEASRALLFDDRAVNLEAAFRRGMRTVLVGSGEESVANSFVHAATNDLPHFLSATIGADLGPGSCMK